MLGNYHITYGGDSSMNEKNIQKSYDYVIIIRKRLIELDYNGIANNLLSLINRIGEKNKNE